MASLLNLTKGKRETRPYPRSLRPSRPFLDSQPLSCKRPSTLPPRWAKGNPRSADYILATREGAKQIIPSAGVRSNPSVFFAVLRHHFVHRHPLVPPRAPGPTVKWVIFIMGRIDFQVRPGREPSSVHRKFRTDSSHCQNTPTSVWGGLEKTLAACLGIIFPANVESAMRAALHFGLAQGFCGSAKEAALPF